MKSFTQEELIDKDIVFGYTERVLEIELLKKLQNNFNNYGGNQGSDAIWFALADFIKDPDDKNFLMLYGPYLEKYKNGIDLLKDFREEWKSEHFSN